MVDSFAVGKTQAVEPSFGSYVDTWQLPVNANFGTFDAAVSGTTTIDLTGVVASNPYVNITFSEFNATANPTPWTQPNAGQNLRINLIGSVSFGVTVLIQPVAGFWIFTNATSGTADIIVRSSAGGGTSVVIPRGYNSIVYSDGVNISWADQGNVIANVPQSIPPGAIMPFAMATTPANWLPCNGSAVSRSVYFALFSAIGTTWGIGDGSTTFNVPNFNQGAFLRGTGGNAAALGAQQADTVGPHTHPITDPGHFHTPLNSSTNGNFLAIVADGPGQVFRTNCGVGSGPLYSSFQTEPATTGITVNANTDTVETRPINYSVNYCIKT